MLNPQRTVTIIPAKPLEERQAMRRQLRVAAYLAFLEADISAIKNN